MGITNCCECIPASKQGVKTFINSKVAKNEMSMGNLPFFAKKYPNLCKKMLKFAFSGLQSYERTENSQFLNRFFMKKCLITFFREGVRKKI